jgi:hypothetical protein
VKELAAACAGRRFEAGPGLLVWRINDGIVRTGLLNNTVNADPNNPGVYLVQADGRQDLDDIAKQNRGSSGHPFPGSTHNMNLDQTTRPALVGKFGLCNIKIDGGLATFDLHATSGCRR